MDNETRNASEANAYTTPSESPAKSSGRNSTAGNTTSGGQPATPALCTCSEENSTSSMSVCLCDKLAALRAPAMTIRYNMEKRHIPDLDAERQKNGPKPVSGKASSNRSDCDCPAENEPAAERMLCRGTWTVRYFDLAVGAVAMVAIGCMIKGCLCMCGMMKK